MEIHTNNPFTLLNMPGISLTLRSVLIMLIGSRMVVDPYPKEEQISPLRGQWINMHGHTRKLYWGWKMLYHVLILFNGDIGITLVRVPSLHYE